jgi:hypothetical protein
VPHKDPIERAAYLERHYTESGDQIRAAVRDHYHANRDTIRARRLELRDRHLAKNAERERLRYAAWRAEALAAYGGACACCGESHPLFLEFDHVESDGAAHRRQIGISARALLACIRREGYPSRFRLLCSNCNQGRKRNGGVCPHVAASIPSSSPAPS